IHRVGHRSGIAACRKLRFPKFFSSLDVEGANVRIERVSDKHQTGGGYDGAAESDRSWRHRLMSPTEIFHGAKRDLPFDRSLIHIHGTQRPPRWRSTGEV